jgi:peptidoglycan/LPS O-acetylase OafA/YrhL
MSSTGASSLKHRPDIDGMRAVAVLVVVAYHMGLPIHGGFVGVDVFFVISGFLISSIILTQIKAGTFTFASFYERRTRRIFPALFVTLAVTTVLAYRYLLPIELEDYARSLIAANLSGSNFYFWLTSGYFDNAAASKPLLHTWSLAVEEQFYVVLPIFFWVLKRYAPKRLELSVYCFAAASFALSAVGAYRYPTATFYLAPTRAWELLLGSIISLETFPRLRHPVVRELGGLLGIAMILGASFRFQQTTVFPGISALLPCGGAALIIVAGRDQPSWVGRALSLRPVVFVGLISYSLYLWHWPVIVFSSLGMTLVSGLARRESQALVFVLSMVAATASWRFVERPFRFGGALDLTRAAIFKLALGAIASVAVIGGVGLALHGLPDRFPLQARKVAEYLDQERTHDQFRTDTCFMTARDWDFDKFDPAACMPADPSKGTMLILGDSHAAHLWWGMNAVHSDRLNVMQATSAGCKPVLEQRPRQFPGCTRLMTYVLTQYLPSHHVDTLLLGARWESGDLPSLAKTLEWLRSQHVHVVLFGPMLQYDAPLPRLLAMSIRQNDPDLPALHRVTAMSALDVGMAASAKSEWRVPYVSLIDLLCDKDDCVKYAGTDVPLLSDYGHLTKDGSVLVATRLRDEAKFP